MITAQLERPGRAKKETPALTPIVLETIPTKDSPVTIKTGEVRRLAWADTKGAIIVKSGGTLQLPVRLRIFFAVNKIISILPIVNDNCFVVGPVPDKSGSKSGDHTFTLDKHPYSITFTPEPGCKLQFYNERDSTAIR